MNKKHLYTNRLINQKSPYLLQHAHNPVDWYPWGEEAFSLAQENNRPIFLSIGYATCHWCHVMEKESFESAEIATLMNDTFVNIKVDREELPAVDSLYMEFAQSIMAGTAGWPLNVILTPNLLPFFAATYLPPQDAHGMMGLVELVDRIQEVWYSDEREHVVEQAEKIVEVFNQSIHARGEELPEKELIEDTADLLFQLADPIYGGMKGSPKFPIGYQYIFLLRYFRLKKESRALFIVEKTLDMMHRGGIYDHLGGGFSRYSVDEMWLVPHFEKMLYDNALLAQAYVEAWLVTKKDQYRQIAKEILDYVLRDMTGPQGGFYSAEDADSEGHEGFFYTWTHEEIVSLLGKEESALFCEFYNVTEEGNFEGRNILNTPISLDEFASKSNLPIESVKNKFKAQRKILWTARELREHPFKDDKVLSSWNGLMIAVLALAGRAFGEDKYLRAATQAATFIEDYMVVNGHLFRRWRDGEAMFSAGLEEYAFLIRGYLSLFEADAGSVWLERAIGFSELLAREFKAEGGAFYQTDGCDPSVIIRKCQFSDGAEPSGNAVQAENLLKLSQMTFYPHFLEQAEDVFKASQKYIENYPPGYSYHVMNLLRFYDKSAPTIIVAFNESRDHCEELGQLIFGSSFLHKVVIWKDSKDKKLLSLAPALENYPPLAGKTTLYICRQGACRSPMTAFSDMKKALEVLS